MKKIMVLLVAIGMTICNTVCVNAKEDIDLENILSREATIEEVEEVGKRIEQEKNSNNKARMDEEVWSLKTKTKLYSRRAIKGKFGKKVASYTDETSTISVSLSAKFDYKPTSDTTLSLTGGISKSDSITYKGPNGEKLPNGQKADARLFFAIMYGEIYRYQYEVRTKYTNSFVRYEYVDAVVAPEVFALSQLMTLNSGGSITVANKNGTACKNYSSLSAYQSALQKSSYACEQVYFF